MIHSNLSKMSACEKWRSMWCRLSTLLEQFSIIPNVSKNFTVIYITSLCNFHINSEFHTAFIKDSVRPSYWIPDSEVINCCVCDRKFSAILSLHHCRACGRGVCQECSQHRKPVPHRGWNHPVRVCNACVWNHFEIYVSKKKKIEEKNIQRRTKLTYFT